MAGFAVWNANCRTRGAEKKTAKRRSLLGFEVWFCQTAEKTRLPFALRYLAKATQANPSSSIAHVISF
jgi:hypothetical protein